MDICRKIHAIRIVDPLVGWRFQHATGGIESENQRTRGRGEGRGGFRRGQAVLSRQDR